MKSNYELVKQILAEVNEDYGYSKLDGLCILGTEIGDTLYIGFGADYILKITEELLEELDDPFEAFIYHFYTYNEKAQSKKKAECYKRDLEQKFKEILASDDEDEILYLVEKAKRTKAALDNLKSDLAFTKEVGKLLYYAKNLFEIRVEEDF